MTDRNIIFARSSADSGVSNGRASATKTDKLEPLKYVLVITLIAVMAISALFSLVTIYNLLVKAAAGTSFWQSKGNLPDKKGEGALASPQTEFRKITAFDGTIGDRLGVSAAISGDMAIVGARADVVPPGRQGAAYIFERNHPDPDNSDESNGGVDNWGEVKRLTASDGEINDAFGFSTAISGNTAVVGAFRKDMGNNLDQGAVYIFSRNAGGEDNWGEVKRLLASDGAAGDLFGVSVAISGDTIVASAVSNNGGKGSVYIFERNAGGADNWGEVKKVTATDGETGDGFGRSLAATADIIIVGAFGDKVGDNLAQGSAYIFSRNAGGANNWGEVKHLIASDGATGDLFGFSVAINGDAAVVGADGNDIGNNSDQGSVYVFERNQGGANNWGEVKRLLASDGDRVDSFGRAVAIDGDTIVVGVETDNVGNNIDQGSAYIFRRDQGGADNWGEVKQLLASDGEEGDLFGHSVAISGDTVIVSAHFDAVGNNPIQGSAYIFLLDTTPAQTFDFCLQDDYSGSRQLAFNSQTGVYFFCDGSVTIGGVGLIARKGSTITLTHTSTDRRVVVSLTLSSFAPPKGSASLQMLTTKKTYTITDSNTDNNKCSCAVPRL